MNTEPNTRCDRHLDQALPWPCGDCQTARETREQWLRDRAAQRAEEARTLLQREHAARVAGIPDCGMCDEFGYAALAVCHHNPDQPAINARGIELVNTHRAALQEGPIDE